MIIFVLFTSILLMHHLVFALLVIVEQYRARCCCGCGRCCGGGGGSGFLGSSCCALWFLCDFFFCLRFGFAIFVNGCFVVVVVWFWMHVCIFVVVRILLLLEDCCLFIWLVMDCLIVVGEFVEKGVEFCNWVNARLTVYLWLLFEFV